ncbi:MAG TPA: hypothetical protein VLW44_13055 [Streptosporangiaceae bacterium]|nr:hypothetical protein [Streptosporangiaceae bacterium]
MQGMVSGALLVAAFGMVAAASGVVAARLYQVSRWAGPAGPGEQGGGGGQGGPGTAREPADA